MPRTEHVHQGGELIQTRKSLTGEVSAHITERHNDVSAIQMLNFVSDLHPCKARVIDQVLKMLTEWLVWHVQVSNRSGCHCQGFEKISRFQT